MSTLRHPRQGRHGADGAAGRPAATSALLRPVPGPGRIHCRGRCSAPASTARAARCPTTPPTTAGEGYCSAAGVDIDIHQLRHAHATEQVPTPGCPSRPSAGAPGHASTETTQLYAPGRTTKVADAEIRARPPATGQLTPLTAFGKKATHIGTAAGGNAAGFKLAIARGRSIVGQTPRYATVPVPNPLAD